MISVLCPVARFPINMECLRSLEHMMVILNSARSVLSPQWQERYTITLIQKSHACMEGLGLGSWETEGPDGSKARVIFPLEAGDMKDCRGARRVEPKMAWAGDISCSSRKWRKNFPIFGYRAPKNSIIKSIG